VRKKRRPGKIGKIETAHAPARGEFKRNFASPKQRGTRKLNFGKRRNYHEKSKKKKGSNTKGIFKGPAKKITSDDCHLHRKKLRIRRKKSPMVRQGTVHRQNPKSPNYRKRPIGKKKSNLKDKRKNGREGIASGNCGMNRPTWCGEEPTQ